MENTTTTSSTALVPWEPTQEDQISIKLALDKMAEREAIVVADQATYDKKVNGIKIVKADFDYLEARRDELVRPLNDEVKRRNAFFRPILDKLAAAENLWKRQTAGWMFDQEQKRLVEQRRIQAETEAREIARRKELEKEAKKLEKAGLIETAAEIRVVAETPLMVPEACSTYDKQSGVSSRRTWKWELKTPYADATVQGKDRIKQEIILHAIENKLGLIPRAYLMPDGKKLDKYAAMSKGEVPLLGIKIYPVDSLAVSAYK